MIQETLSVYGVDITSKNPNLELQPFRVQAFA